MTQPQLLAAAAAITAAHESAVRGLATERAAAARATTGCGPTATRDYRRHALVQCEVMSATAAGTEAAKRRATAAIAHSCRPNLRARVEQERGEDGAGSSPRRFYYELRAIQAIAAGEALSLDRRPHAALVGPTAGSRCLAGQTCLHCDQEQQQQQQQHHQHQHQQQQRGAYRSSRSPPVVDGARSLLCPFCIPVDRRERGYVLPPLEHRGPAGEISPIVGGAASAGDADAEQRWLCSRPGCQAGQWDRSGGCPQSDGVPESVVDVALGANSIAPTYLSLEAACEGMVRNMCTEDVLWCLPANSLHEFTQRG
jgi:hypothetical protein